MTTAATAPPSRRTRVARALLLAGTAVALLVGAGCVPYPSGGPGSTPTDQTIHDLLILVNQDRAANGVAPLAWDGQLGGLAAVWSGHMADTGVLEHRDFGPILASPTYAGLTGYGENIQEAGCGTSAQSIEAAFMNSPAHRADILSAGYTSVGIGAHCSADGHIWVTQDFGTRAG